MANSIYNVMYELNASISIGVGTNTDPTIMQIQSSDIVSIAIIHKYDTATYPIIRLRIYADMSLMELINGIQTMYMQDSMQSVDCIRQTMIRTQRH